MSKSDQIYKYIFSKIQHIRTISDTGTGREIMANLRHGIGKKPGEIPELWGMIFEGIPAELTGYREASNAEWAVYTALTLYALHQQGNDAKENDTCMNKNDISVGRAAARLVNDKEDIKRILNRLNLVVTSVSPEDLAYHLRGLVQLLKSKKIALDYARLAKELYQFYHQEYSEEIKLSWGRDFYGELYKLNEKENNNE
ncbi:MAG: type I-E CRISPR-associated protein Cse2/CasB [Oscillospiraceae bacterium]|nr:type I-E CRISPR-associated protein Cse2/CasB [Oscillospiraceae bacterium]